MDATRPMPQPARDSSDDPCGSFANPRGNSGPTAATARKTGPTPWRRAGQATLLLGLLGMVLAACDQTGTITLSLVTTPDSTILSDITRARLTLSDPPTIIEAERDASGLVVAIDAEATGAIATVAFEGFDQTGALIAYGQSGLILVNGVTTELTLYVAPPLSLTQAPTSPDPVRTDAAVVPLSFGALVAGGRSSSGAALDTAEVYSVYRHTFLPTASLPAPRVAPATATGNRDRAYLYGGFDAAGAATSTVLTVDPNGNGIAFELASADTGLARTAAAMAALGNETFAVTGAPAVRIDGFAGTARQFDSAPDLAGTATSTVIDQATYTLFAGAGNGASGGIVYADGNFTELAPTPVDGQPAGLARTEHAAVPLPDGTMLVLGGRVGTGPDAPLASAGLRVRPTQGTVENVLRLATPRAQAAAAATEAFVIIAGGVDAAGTVLGDAEVFALPSPNQADFVPMGAIPMVAARRGAQAVPLPNGQVLIVGGEDEAGDPVGPAELFTPMP